MQFIASFSSTQVNSQGQVKCKFATPLLAIEGRRVSVPIDQSDTQIWVACWQMDEQACFVLSS